MSLRIEIGTLLAAQAGVDPSNPLFSRYCDIAEKRIAALRSSPLADPVDPVDVLISAALAEEAERNEAAAEARRATKAAAAANIADQRETVRLATTLDPSLRQIAIRDEATGELVYLRLPAEVCFIRQANKAQLVPLPPRKHDIGV